MSEQRVSIVLPYKILMYLYMYMCMSHVLDMLVWLSTKPTTARNSMLHVYKAILFSNNIQKISNTFAYTIVVPFTRYA